MPSSSLSSLSSLLETEARADSVLERGLVDSVCTPCERSAASEDVLIDDLGALSTGCTASTLTVSTTLYASVDVCDTLATLA